VIDVRFLALLAAGLAGGAALGWRWVTDVPGGPGGLAAGLAFSFASLGLGHHAVRRGAARGERPFLAAVLGGTAARVLALAAFALGLAYGTGLDLVVALLTVVAAHIVFGIVDVVYLQRTGALE